MFRHFLTVALRNLYRRRTFSAISLLGLTVGLGTFILIALYIQHELNFDRFQEKYERICRVESRDHLATGAMLYASTSYPLAEVLSNEVPGIEAATSMRGVYGEYLSADGERIYFEENGWFAHPSIFDVFTFEWVQGEPSQCLAEPNSIVLSERVAAKYFPDRPAMGQTLRVRNQLEVKVTGIFRDLPESSSLRIDYLHPIGAVEQFLGWSLDDWGNVSYSTFIALESSALRPQVAASIRGVHKSRQEGSGIELELRPLSALHLMPDDKGGLGVVLALYGLLGILALTVACINFTNLTTAFAAERAREIGIKKAIGGSRSGLMAQFLMESTILSLLSLAMAFLVAELTLPLFNGMVERNLDIDYSGDWPFILLMVAVALVSGLTAGFYPALHLSAYRPAAVLKSGFARSGGQSNFRRALVTAQFAISSVMVLMTVLILRQFNYMKTMDLGFDREHILFTRIETDHHEQKRDFELLRERLLQHPGIVSASMCDNLPFEGNWGSVLSWEGAGPEERINVRRNNVSYDYIQTLGLKLTQGRNFDRNIASDAQEACIINETAVRDFGWENPLGRTIDDGRYRVIGVVRDFHPYSPYAKIPPFMLHMNDGTIDQSATFALRIAAGHEVTELRKYASDVFAEFYPNSYFEFQLLDDQVRQDETLHIYAGIAETFGFFATVTLLIAAVGLFGLVAYSTQTRTKEIGIRKVHGASTGRIYGLLAREFIVLILLANVIAWPLATGIRWIDPVHYKVELAYWEYALGLVCVFLVAMMTIGYHTWKAARMNPAQALRYE